MSQTKPYEPAVALHKNGAAPGRTERRSQPRRSSLYMAFIRDHHRPQGAFQPAMVWDVSAEGIALCLDQALQPGDVLEVTFRHLGIQDRIATVIHATAQGQGWRIGCILEE